MLVFAECHAIGTESGVSRSHAKASGHPCVVRLYTTSIGPTIASCGNDLLIL